MDKWFKWFFAGLMIYSMAVTLILGALLYCFVTAREFDKGYNMGIKYSYEAKNKITPRELRVTEKN